LTRFNSAGQRSQCFHYSGVQPTAHVFGRHGCGRHGHALWPSWFVADMVEPRSSDGKSLMSGCGIIIVYWCDCVVLDALPVPVLTTVLPGDI